MTTLPVSRFRMRCRLPVGRDDLALLEAGRGALNAPSDTLQQAVGLLTRLCSVEDGAFGGWETVTVTDFESALLGLRRFLFGDRVACLFRCTGCGERMEIEFSIAALLEDARPRPARRAFEQQDGWYRLAEGRFRLPCIADQLEFLGRPRAERLLRERCVEGADAGRAERAMEALAPIVSRPLEGRCQACGQTLLMPLSVPAIVLAEVHMAAAGVHEEIHSIAEHYHWSEADILDLPQVRRQAYAESIARQRRLAG